MHALDSSNQNSRMNRKLLAAIAGSSAMGIGIGLHRSQFAVLGELMAANGWFANSTIGILSGISLAGYIIGCLQQSKIKSEKTNIICIRYGLAIAVITFFIEPLSSVIEWQAFWRLTAGWASAQLVVGIPGFVTRQQPAHDHRFLVAWTISGSGIAAFIASLLVSLFASASVVGAWFVTGALSLLLAWPINDLLSLSKQEIYGSKESEQYLAYEEKKPHPSIAYLSKPLAFLAVSAFFFGAAQAAVIVYYPLLLISKFEIGQSLAQALFSSLGLGYMLGAIGVGFLPNRYTTDTAMTFSAFIGLIGVFMCAASPLIEIVGLGGFLFGLWNGSMISLLLDRINQSTESHLARVTWSRFSLILSIGFTIGATCLSPIANNNVALIMWISLFLLAIHLSSQSISKHLFSRTTDLK
ncbi:MAG: hypothetical protein CMK50_04250 [Propionibacteriaceae bacterium]|nr:hypothetical protein [Propionibacteriaceae bacterium]